MGGDGKGKASSGEGGGSGIYLLMKRKKTHRWRERLLEGILTALYIPAKSVVLHDPSTGLLISP